MGLIGEESFSSALEPHSRLVGRRGVEESSASMELHRLDNTTRCTRRGCDGDVDDDGGDDDSFQREFCKSPWVEQVFVVGHIAMIVEAWFGVDSVRVSSFGVSGFMRLLTDSKNLSLFHQDNKMSSIVIYCKCLMPPAPRVDTYVE